MQFVDTHCHPFFPDLISDLPGVLERAHQARVTKIIAVGTDLEDSAASVKIAGEYENVWAAIGVHPHAAEDFQKDKQRKSIMTELLGRPKVAAVGEIGLDHYKSRTPEAVQARAFREQIEIGLPSGLPFIFHVRDAWSDFWQIFDEYKNLSGVVHSFSSGRKQLDAALSRGLYIGLNGIMTFTKDQAQLEAAKQVPLDRLVLETDAPFLTPAPFREEVCEPKHVANTAEFLAQLRDQSMQELAKATTNNAQRLFNLT
jgi:TatD DNase family protein